ncbi:DUF3088 family protein [Pseudodesulfovibrio indicus]|uniref:DUF3088 family protein n=1 Tax=Pseudodesulfovibrio indicus TaxID=1716143 RepID=UPI00292EA48E|nr:DUF3088 family protein [Pseudodesulfovibrio indicus]
MAKDILFTLAAGFTRDLQGPLYCPECAIMEGLLHYHPELREQLDVRTIDFKRPRPEIVALLGETHQDCPCLIVAEPTKADGLPVSVFEDKTFINDHKAIIEYLARNYETSRPAHD